MAETWYCGNEKRQVYAAFKRVPVEICIKCDFFREDPGYKHFNQPGVCYFARSEARELNITGKCLCDEETIEQEGGL